VHGESKEVEEECVLMGLTWTTGKPRRSPL